MCCDLEVSEHAGFGRLLSLNDLQIETKTQNTPTLALDFVLKPTMDAVQKLPPHQQQAFVKELEVMQMKDSLA